MQQFSLSLSLQLPIIFSIQIIQVSGFNRQKFKLTKNFLQYTVLYFLRLFFETELIGSILDL